MEKEPYRSGQRWSTTTEVRVETSGESLPYLKRQEWCPVNLVKKTSDSVGPNTQAVVKGVRDWQSVLHSTHTWFQTHTRG